MSWEILVKIGHIVGTVLGVGGATFAEIFYHQATKGGTFDPAAGKYLGLTYRVLRLGMILLVLSGFGYLLLLRFSGQTQHIYSERLWAKLVITLVILINAVLLQTKKIPMLYGSAVSLVSWYAALVLGAWRGLGASFYEIILWYAAAIALVAGVKKLFSRNKI